MAEHLHKNQSRIDLRRFELDAALREHAEMLDAWKMVESKAQPASAVGGVFLAGVFSYASQQASGVSTVERALLVLLAVGLVTSTLLALKSIWTTTIDSPHIGEELQGEIAAIINGTLPPVSLEDRFESVLADASGRLVRTSTSIRGKLEVKVRLLDRSLKLLGASALVGAVLIPVTLFIR